MTTSVVITGTGNPIPSATRAGPGVLVRTDQLLLQFDAGRGTLQRLAALGVAAGQLDAVFATHHHSDHLTALPDLVMTRWILDADDDVASLPIVVPSGPAVDFVDRMLEPWDHDLAVRSEHNGRPAAPRYETVSFDVAVHPSEVWANGDVRVLAGRVRHEPVLPAVGYRIETPDGVVAITGDTLVCDEVAELAADADILVYEAMRFEVIEQRPPHLHYILDYHADTRLIGAQAAELRVATLVLTHLIPEPHAEADKQLFVDDIRSGGFHGELVVADDLDTVSLG